MNTRVYGVVPDGKHGERSTERFELRGLSSVSEKNRPGVGGGENDRILISSGY